MVPVVLQTVQCHGDPYFVEDEDRDEVCFRNQKTGEVIALTHGNLISSLHRIVGSVRKRAKDGKRVSISSLTKCMSASVTFLYVCH